MPDASTHAHSRKTGMNRTRISPFTKATLAAFRVAKAGGIFIEGSKNDIGVLRLTRTSNAGLGPEVLTPSVMGNDVPSEKDWELWVNPSVEPEVTTSTIWAKSIPGLA